MASIELTDTEHVPVRYLPKILTNKDRKQQTKNLIKSRKLYIKNQYFKRPTIKSFKSRRSRHLANAKELYNVENVYPNAELAKKTQCKLSSLKKIVNKGEGAYYSSGSRPNQTSQSWGRARLASALTGGNASIVDYDILYHGCKPNSMALKLATKTCKKQKKCKKYTIKNTNISLNK
jgi:hypothetical protein